MSQTKIPARFRDAEDAVHEAAIAMSGGYEDFGPGTYQPGLRVLLEALDNDSHILPERRAFVFNELAMSLAARLYTEAGWAANPAARQTPIRAPLIVTGLPRSCTTVLQRLLAVDPQFQFIDSWLAHAPQTRPTGDPRHAASFQRARARLDDWFRQVPHMRSAHDMAVDDPEECIEVLRQEFVTNRFGCTFNVPSYDRWWLAQSEGASYQRWADVLRLLGAAEPERRWLLKNPGHIGEMDRILALFPDACIVHTHRDPLKAMPSVASVVHMAHQTSEGPASDPLIVGPRETLVWSRGMQHMLETRRRHPGRFHDVYHHDYVRDPLVVVKGIYARFGLELLPAVERAMQSWIDANPQGLHGEHHYTLERFGLRENDVREAFDPYIQAFGPV